MKGKKYYDQSWLPEVFCLDLCHFCDYLPCVLIGEVG